MKALQASGNISQDPRVPLCSYALPGTSCGLSPLWSVSEQEEKKSRVGSRMQAGFGGRFEREKPYRKRKRKRREIVEKETSEGERQSRAW